MTNKTKLIFVVVSTVLAVLSMLMCTQFAFDIGGRALPAVANVLGLLEAPTFSALGLFVISGLYLTFRRGGVLRRKRGVR